MISSEMFSCIEKIKLPHRYNINGSISGLKVTQLIESEKELEIISLASFKSRGPNYKRILVKSFGEEQYILEFSLYKDLYGDHMTGVIRADGCSLDNGLLSLENPRYREQKNLPDNANEIYEEVNNSWLSGIRFESEIWDKMGERKIRKGLRHVQSGALHAISAHWTLSSVPATIIMPTGTGKTEVMIACCITSFATRLLVVVPTDPLREQISKKFERYGILKEIGVISDLPKPIIGTLSSKPTWEHLEYLEKCNIVVTTMQSISLAGDEVQKKFSSLFSHIFFDEAHHIEASSWKKFRDNSESSKILLFTATPFRENGKPIEGKIIYNYPLSTAQEQGYFKPINFIEVFEPEENIADEKIATAAVDQLRRDIAQGHDHILMARAYSIEKAQNLYDDIYTKKFSDLNPVLIHSKSPNKKNVLSAIRSGRHKIIVCVSMFGEGYDLPELKVAALHCVHKSIGATLQFIGRFTRSSSNNSLGTATFVANTADDNVPEALESLYQENADWNELIADLSFDAIYPQTQLSNLISNMENLAGENKSIEISSLALRPKISAQVFKTSDFFPDRYREAFSNKQKIVQSQINREDNFLILIVNQLDRIDWTSSREIAIDSWDLFICYYDSSRQLLYINSSRKKGEAIKLAKTISSEPKLINGEDVFKVFSGIRRLTLHNVGLSSLSRNVRYQMYAGLDVGNAIDPIQEHSKLKSNITGVGYEEGIRTCFGCSRKGKIWSARSGSLASWRSWCDIVGAKLALTNQQENDFLKYTLIPKVVTSLPSTQIIMVDWPDQLFECSHFQFNVFVPNEEFGFDDCEIDYVSQNTSHNCVQFRLSAGQSISTLFELKLGEGLDETIANYKVSYISGDVVEIGVRNSRQDAASFFSENPPLIRFNNGSQLSGDILLQPREVMVDTFNRDDIKVIDWANIDTSIETESRWRFGVFRPDSVQQKFIEYLMQDNDYSFIIDDDDTGESADIVAIKDHADKIIVYLWHCKYSSSENPGNRVNDLYEVCGQAQKSVKWTWNFNTLIKHLHKRESVCLNNRPTRFIKGSISNLNTLRKSSKRKFIEYQIGIVQPGLSKQNMPPDHLAILGATNSLIQCMTNKTLAVYASQ